MSRYTVIAVTHQTRTVVLAVEADSRDDAREQVGFYPFDLAEHPGVESLGDFEWTDDEVLTVEEEGD